MTVAAILSGKGKTVISAGPQDSLEVVSKKLAEHKIGALIVLKPDNSVCGIASERDIVRQIARQGAAALSKPVSDCMTKKVISCSTSDTVDQVMGVMNKNKFRHLPVIEDSKLLGIISIGDVVKMKIEKAEREAEDLKQYISG